MIKFYSNLAAAKQHLTSFKWLAATALFLLAFTFQIQAQEKQWDRTFGGNDADILYSAEQTSDGGYILGGYSSSEASGDRSDPLKGIIDFWVIKTDANGNKQWDKALGGDGINIVRSVSQTRDGGYIVGGYSSSGISGDKTEPSNGATDFWIVKLDASGNKVWDRTYGGKYTDMLHSLDQTSDGGYILGGLYNFGSDGIASSEPDSLYWVVKLDENGYMQWDKKLGGEGANHLFSVKQTGDGGYVLGGYTYAGKSGDKSEASRGKADYWIVKLDATGNKLWDRTYGGDDYDILADLALTNDGGFIVGGLSQSGQSFDKSEASRGGSDYWIVKLDATGNKQWDRTYGGSSSDGLRSLSQTTDGGYILGGFSSSGVSGEKSEASNGLGDFWVVKVDGSGNKLWDRSLGSTNGEGIHSIFQTRDGGYFAGGESYSEMGGDKTQPSRGSIDFWIIKLSGEMTPMPTGECYTSTFNQDDHGLITSTSTAAGKVAIFGRKLNSDGSYAAENHAAIFDSQAPTGDDADLYTTTWGNILIINQDLTGEPNDNEWGGELVLDFSAIGPVTMNSLQAIDVDVYEFGSKVVLYDVAGKELYTAEMQNLGDNSKQTINLGNTKGVVRMKIMLTGSAGIDDIQFCSEADEEPEAETVAMGIQEARAYPNPSPEKATIEFKLEQAESYVVNLYDMKGNLIRELKEGIAQKGELVSVKIDGADLRSGLYFARIVSSSGSKTIKLILEK